MRAVERDPAVAQASKTERIALRTSAEAKSLIESAARALGINASEFVTAAACREARETLRRREMTTVPPEAARAFVDAFERAEPAPALVELMRLHADVTKAQARADAPE
jgi:uncharacterized protein (DUF1778 family)